MSEKTQFPGDTHRESAQYGLQIWLHIFRKGAVATRKAQNYGNVQKDLGSQWSGAELGRNKQWKCTVPLNGTGHR